jgi:nonsense-mediated mRNA decay protein 3
MRCVSCGEREAVAEYLCEGCYLKKHEPKVAREIRVANCPVCEMWKGRGGWTEDALSAYRGALAFKRGTFEISNIELDDDVLRVTLRSTTEGVSAEAKRDVKVRTDHMTCPRCSRSSGGYYEATIQIRGDQAPTVVSEARSMVEGSGEPNAFIAKEEEVRGGSDLRVGSWKTAERVARELASRYGGEFKSSRKLHTRRNNKDVYRMSYLVRLPGIGKGDVFEHGGAFYTYLNPAGRSTHARSLGTGEDVRIQMIASSIEPVAHASDARAAVVVSETESEVQVLDPDTMRTIELKRPASIERGELTRKREVMVIRIKGDWMIYVE